MQSRRARNAAPGRAQPDIQDSERSQRNISLKRKVLLKHARGRFGGSTTRRRYSHLNIAILAATRILRHRASSRPDSEPEFGVTHAPVRIIEDERHGHNDARAEQSRHEEEPPAR